MAGHDDKSRSGRIFFEFTQVGQQMRVAAIDEASGTEVVAIAPLSATPAQMQQLALGKLRHKLGYDATTKQPSPIRPGGKYA